MQITLKDGRKVNAPDKQIMKIMHGLKVDKREAIKIYLEDEDKLHNEEQEALCKKAKESDVMRTIHDARDVTKLEQKTQRERVRKPNETKAEIINTLFTTLQNFGAENIVIEKAEKLITFSLGGKNFKLDLIQQRDKK